MGHGFGRSAPLLSSKEEAAGLSSRNPFKSGRVRAQEIRQLTCHGYSPAGERIYPCDDPL